jgi:hypothetical protein
MRLLITACSATKRSDAGLLPAIDRYNGPSFRTLRKALRELAEERRPTVLILSGKFGLIESGKPIPNYDQRMTASLAVQLRSQVRSVLTAHLERRSYDETCINLGGDYLPALPDLESYAQLGRLTSTHGGIGERLGQLKRWLYREKLEEDTLLRLRLLRGWGITHVAQGRTREEVAANLREFLDQCTQDELHGLTVQKSSDRRCTMVCLNEGILLWNQAGFDVIFTDTQKAREAFLEYAISDGWQWF